MSVGKNSINRVFIASNGAPQEEANKEAKKEPVKKEAAPKAKTEAKKASTSKAPAKTTQKPKSAAKAPAKKPTPKAPQGREKTDETRQAVRYVKNKTKTAFVKIGDDMPYYLL